MLFNMVGKSGGSSGPITLKSLSINKTSFNQTVATTDMYRLTITFPRAGEYFITCVYAFGAKNQDGSSAVSVSAKYTTANENCSVSAGATLEFIGSPTTNLVYKVTTTAANQQLIFSVKYPYPTAYYECTAIGTAYVLYTGETISSITASQQIIRV